MSSEFRFKNVMKVWSFNDYVVRGLGGDEDRDREGTLRVSGEVGH